MVDAALEKQASDILLLDLRGVCSFTDYFVICSGESERQLQAICDEIDNALSTEHLPPGRQQGGVSSGWIILDAGDIIVHIFTAEQRKFYTIEELWNQGSTVVKIL
ncbi:MAG: ribosome silencing factor [Dehalococcoidia bacterium]